MNIVNTMLWMKRNAYEDSTIKKSAKLLQHLKRNCNTTDPEAVKLFIANKTCSNAHKENLSARAKPHRKVPSAFAGLKVNFYFCSSLKSLRLKVYSLGTSTQEGTHINPNKEWQNKIMQKIGR